MSQISAGHHGGPGRYEIRFKGYLDSRWAAWFDGLSITRCGDGTTIIHGPVADQAAPRLTASPSMSPLPNCSQNRTWLAEASAGRDLQRRHRTRDLIRYAG